jgi:hypothetical protein
MSNRLRQAVWSVALLGLLASGCGRTTELASPPPPAATSLTAASGLTSKDEIDGLDLASGPGDALHLVWRERRGLYGGNAGHERILYRRGHGRPLRWDAPVIVAEDTSGTPQVAVARDGVHVFAGARLHHWVLPEGGGPASDRGEMLASEAPIAGAFDAAAVGDAVTIFFLASDRSEDRNAYSLRWSAGEGVAPRTVVAAFPPAPSAAHPAPRLLPGADNTLVAAWANNTLAQHRDERTGATAYRAIGRVHAAWSRDGGRSWEREREVTTAPLASPVGAVAITGTPAAPAVFQGATSLVFSGWRDGAWDRPITVAAYTPGFLSSGSRTSAVAATQCEGSLALAWTDKRHQRSDRRWWKPLGGAPWSDSPDWINNDLFVLSGKAATHALAGAPASPQRLTAAGSLTSEVAIAHRDGELIVLRAGRARVRKSPDDAGAAPAIEQSRIPCD